jgi:dynein heavy chain, axonemal
LCISALDEAIRKFDEAKAGVMNKDYNYLDHRNKEFDEDYDKFSADVEELKNSISDVIEKNYDTVWESPQAIKFLIKFEKVSNE